MKCPRDNCKNEAEVHAVFGVLPCRSCREKDSKTIPRIAQGAEFPVQSKADRIQHQRDKHSGDIEQPFIGNKPNPQFAKINPDRVGDYFTKDQLKNME